MRLPSRAEEHLELLLPVRVLRQVQEPPLRGDGQVRQAGRRRVRAALAGPGLRRGGRATVQQVEDGGVDRARRRVHGAVQVAVGEENLAHRRERAGVYGAAHVVHAEAQ